MSPTKKIILAALAGPAAIWIGAMLIGRMKGDAAGTMIWTSKGFILPVHRGLFVESMAAGALVGWLALRS